MILLSDLSVRTSGSDYVLGLAAGPVRYTAPTDADLGQIMTVLSVGYKTLDTALTGTVYPPTQVSRNGILLTAFTIRRIPIIGEFSWHLTMQWQDYRYDADVDRDLESVLHVFGAALKFFAFKAKLITIDPDVTRRREDAARYGFLTKEDG